MKNTYEIRGEVTAIFLRRKDGTRLETLIDTEDLERVSEFFGSLYCDHGYVIGHPKADYRTKTYLHRFIQAPGVAHVDHVSHNKLDNRKAELRITTRSENLLNRRGATILNHASGHRGVYLHRVGRWGVRFTICGKTFSFGLYRLKSEAIKEADLRIGELRRNDFRLPPHWEAGRKVGKSGFRGVEWQPRNKTWRARIRNKHLGYFSSPEAASVAVQSFLSRGTA